LPVTWKGSALVRFAGPKRLQERVARPLRTRSETSCEAREPNIVIRPCKAITSYHALAPPSTPMI
jgi:hypothetical protein